MVICKFFLQGTCKFGDFCKFEHQINDNFNNYQSSTSILRQSHFGNTQQQVKPATNPSNVDTNTLVKSVVNDMTVAEKGGQWLLSCYAPFKEKPAFPGFEDYSFEEIRLGYYEANKNGTVDQYVPQVQMMLQQAVMRLKSLQSPSPDIVNILKNIYNTPAASHCGVYGSNTTTTTTAFNSATNTSSVFGQQPSTFGQQQQPSSSMFAQPNQSVFAKPVQPQNQFSGASNSIFAGNTSQNQLFKGQTSSIFGSPQTQPQNTNVNIFQQVNSGFAAQSGGSIFGGQQSAPQATPGSIFNATQPNNSIFGGGQPTQSGSIFAGPQTTSTSIFGAQQTAPAFATPQTQPGSGNIFSNTFTNQNTGGSFGQNMFGAQAFTPNNAAQNVTPQAPTNIFANQTQLQNTQNPMFGQQQPSMFAQQNVGAVFSQQNAVPAFSQPPTGVSDVRSHSNSIFGTSQSTVVPNLGFGQVQQVDETVYSKLEELTEDEVKWFESDDLDISRIPEKPPTLQMCFKT